MAMQAQADPSLLKAYVRAGTAHWKLGDLEAAAGKYEYACNQPNPPPEAFTRREELKQFVQIKSKVSFTDSASDRNSKR